MKDLIVFPEGTTFRYRNSRLFVSSGHGIHRSRMTHFFDLILVERGLLSIREGHRDYQVRPGEVLLLSPHVGHAGTRSYPPDLSYYWLEFLADRDKSTVATGHPIGVPRYGYAARRDRLIEILRWIQDDSVGGTLMEDQFQSLMVLALTELQRSAVRPHSERSGAKVALAKRAEKYILTHFREPLSISVVARALRCNPDYLGRCVKAVTGLTVTDVVQELRTMHARFLLCQLDATIDQVADACGYSDSRYFRKVFRRHTGLSPSAYRTLNGGVRLNTQVAWHDRADPRESGTQGLLAPDPLHGVGS